MPKNKRTCFLVTGFGMFWIASTRLGNRHFPSPVTSWPRKVTFSRTYCNLDRLPLLVFSWATNHEVIYVMFALCPERLEELTVVRELQLPQLRRDTHVQIFELVPTVLFYNRESLLQTWICISLNLERRKYLDHLYFANWKRFCTREIGPSLYPFSPFFFFFTGRREEI